MLSDFKKKWDGKAVLRTAYDDNDREYNRKAGAVFAEDLKDMLITELPEMTVDTVVYGSSVHGSAGSGAVTIGFSMGIPQTADLSGTNVVNWYPLRHRDSSMRDGNGGTCSVSGLPGIIREKTGPVKQKTAEGAIRDSLLARLDGLLDHPELHRTYGTASMRLYPEEAEYVRKLIDRECSTDKENA